MTEQEITDLGPAFASYLRRFRASFGKARTAKHFDTYCRGLLADLPRKTVEPIALAAGTAVRTLQEFLVTAGWDHDAARDHLHRRLAARQQNLADAGERPERRSAGRATCAGRARAARRGDGSPAGRARPPARDRRGSGTRTRARSATSTPPGSARRES